MKIKQVIKEKSFYLIVKDDGYAYGQRKSPKTASETPLSNSEEIIISMCEYILELSKRVNDGH